MDMKSMNKGNYWAGTVSHIRRAKIEIADEESEEMRTGSWVPRTQKKHKWKVCLLYTSPSPRDSTSS
eukprot:8049473-Prorocentrum_lima.AAC.1